MARTTRTSTTAGDNREEPAVERVSTAKDYPLELATDDPESAPAGVTQSCSMNVSDHLYWGSGQWDRVPFKVETFCSVSLRCDQTLDGIRAAQGLAQQLAWDGAHRALRDTLPLHLKAIREEYFPDLPWPEEDE